jgi:hypothetical protein
MTDQPPPTPAERRAVQRVGLLHLMRLFSLGAVLMGFAISNEVLPAPYWLSWVFAVGGLTSFFFAPPLLARRWKAEDRARGRE